MLNTIHILLFIISMLLNPYAISHANDAPLLSVGKNIRPRDDVPVRMVNEKVFITIGGHTGIDKAYIECLFTLKNEGAPDTVDVGFPRTYETELYKFRASADSKPLTVESVNIEQKSNDISSKPVDPAEWKMFKVPFHTTGQVVEVRNNYRTLLQPEGINIYSDLLFSYIMTTGTYWKGDIEKAEISITLNLPVDQVTSISPAGYSIRNNRIIQWEFSNFEPSEDIRITIMPDFLYERLTIAKKLLDDDPDNAYAHFLLGTVLFNKKYPGGEDVEQEFLKALSIDPLHWEAKWFLVAHYFNNDKIPKAKELLETLIRENPDFQFDVRGMAQTDGFIEWRLSILENK